MQKFDEDCILFSKLKVAGAAVDIQQREATKLLKNSSVLSSLKDNWKDVENIQPADFGIDQTKIEVNL